MTSKKQLVLAALGLTCALGCVAYLNGSTTAEVPNIQSLVSFKEEVGYGQAVLYSDADFGGQQITFGVNQYIDLGSLGWNDKISSFKLGSGIRLDLCRHGGCRGGWDDKISFVGPINSVNMESWNDQATIAQTFPYNKADVNQARVQVFGVCENSFGIAGTFQVGQYDNDAIKANGVDQGGYSGATSTIIIPDGLTIKAWKGRQFNGESMTIAGPSYVDLCFDKYYSGWNDQIASMKVYKSASFDVYGAWVPIAQVNGPLKRTVTIGTTHTSTNEKETTLTNSFSLSMESGFEFEGVSSSVSMTAETSKSERNMVSNSLEMKKEVTLELQCINKDPNTVVALYRWQVQGSRPSDGVSITVNDDSYRCRYNRNANTPPACPPTKCADAECTYCTDNSWIKH